VPEPANRIFPAALNYVLLQGRLMLVGPVHINITAEMPPPSGYLSPTQLWNTRSYFPVPFSSFIPLRHNLLKKKAEILNSVQYFKDKTTPGPTMRNFLFYSKEEINAVLFFFFLHQ